MPPLIITQGTLVDQEYFLTVNHQTYQFDIWTPNNSICTITYSYSSSVPAMVNLITSFTPSSRTFVFNYSSDLTPSGPTFTDYTITVIATVGAVTQQNTF